LLKLIKHLNSNGNLHCQTNTSMILHSCPCCTTWALWISSFRKLKIILEPALLLVGLKLHNQDMPKYYLVGIHSIGGDSWKIPGWKVYDENSRPGRRNLNILKD